MLFLIDAFKKGINLFVFIALVSHAIAQQSNVFRYLTKKDGLSQMAVFAIAQDKSGFIWFGTRDGLNKYDGYQFKVYNNSIDANSLVSNDVRAVIWQVL